jgi:hypothetical protein
MRPSSRGAAPDTEKIFNDEAPTPDQRLVDLHVAGHRDAGFDREFGRATSPPG